MIKFKYYFITALKNFQRNTGYVSLMILSLALGMYCFVMSGLYIRYELTRNDNHEFVDRVYRLSPTFGERSGYIPYAFAEKMKEDHPEIEAVSTIKGPEELYLSHDGENYIKEKIFYANSELFEVFTFPLKYGDEKTALMGLGKVVISSRVAEALFPGLDPVGIELEIHEKGTYLISGVLEEVSTKSVFKPGMLFSEEQQFADNPEEAPKQWSTLTHIKVRSGVNRDLLEVALYKSIKPFIKREGLTGVSSEKLSDAYWGWSHADYGAQHFSLFGVNKQMVYTIALITIGVLLCGFSGYISISLSLALKRAKEIGIRKVNGANAKEIRTQFLIESISYSFVALLLTLVALEITEASVSELFQVPIRIDYGESSILFFLLGFTVVTGFISGVYPSFIVSRFSPVKVLKGFSETKSSGGTLKRGLLIFQFTITLLLLFGTYIMKLQVNKMSQFDDGYLKENVIAFSIYNKKIKSNLNPILDRIQNIPGVDETSGGPFPFNFNGSTKMRLLRGDSLLQDRVAQVFVTSNFFEMMEIDLVEGESFAKDNDGLAGNICIVNEGFLKKYQLNSALGQTIDFNGVTKTIIGVSKDYSDWGVTNLGGDPRVYFLDRELLYTSILIKTTGENLMKAMTSLESIWKEYESVKEPGIEALYAEVDGGVVSMAKTSILFSLLGIVVMVLSLMNLLGVALMFANGKRKSISIRKILGARTFELFGRLVSPFVTYIFIAALVAMPLGYHFMSKYLENYPYRINLNLGQGLFVLLIMVVMVLLVIGFNMFRISRANPSEVLNEQ